MSQDDERIARKLLDLTTRRDRVQIRNGITYLDGYALGNGTVELRSQVVRDRRMRMREVAEGPGMFLLYDGPDGFYVGRPTEAPSLVAPYYSDGISRFQSGLTTVGTNDWRFAAVGQPDTFDRVMCLFYGPTGLRATQENTLVNSAAGRGSGLMMDVPVQRSDLGLNYSHWYTEDNNGTGPNTFPTLAPPAILPDVFFNPENQRIFQNNTLSWAVAPGNLIKADGTIITTSGNPSPWPTSPGGSGGKSGRTASLVDLTLFVHVLSTGPDTITTTPYTYDPDTGVATAGDAFDTPYTHPGSGWLLRRVSYWTPPP
jgi:hypothetical protein